MAHTDSKKDIGVHLYLKDAFQLAFYIFLCFSFQQHGTEHQEKKFKSIFG
jgi:hypothetical protein